MCFHCILLRFGVIWSVTWYLIWCIWLCMKEIRVGCHTVLSHVVTETAKNCNIYIWPIREKQDKISKEHSLTLLHVTCPWSSVISIQNNEQLIDWCWNTGIFSIAECTVYDQFNLESIKPPDQITKTLTQMKDLRWLFRNPPASLTTLIDSRWCTFLRASTPRTEIACSLIIWSLWAIVSISSLFSYAQDLIPEINGCQKESECPSVLGWGKKKKIRIFHIARHIILFDLD